MQNKVLVISGPTASGKTSTSIKIAKLFGPDVEVINFDSLLFYKEISIGTAKPTREERADIIHHMVDSHSIYSPINAADFYKEAVPLINSILEKDKWVILVGGSGFYLQTVLKGMFDSVTSAPEIIEKSDQLYQASAIQPFLDELAQVDPKSFERYHENDHYRIRRALEHYWSTGEAFSKSRENMPDKLDHAPPLKYDWNVQHIYLDVPKKDQWPIIQARTKAMFNQGIVSEVQSLLDNGATGKEKPLKSIGYNEVIQYIQGEIPNIEDCMERINISTRQLAKAQRTWFKKVEKLSYNPLTDWDKIEQTVKDFLDK